MSAGRGGERCEVRLCIDWVNLAEVGFSVVRGAFNL